MLTYRAKLLAFGIGDGVLNPKNHAEVVHDKTEPLPID